MLLRAAEAHDVALARNLGESAREAQSAGVPLVVFFSEPNCPYCELARRDFLAPMDAAHDALTRWRLVEVVITSDTTLVDLAGARQTHAAFARARRVRFVPTVLFLDARGESLAEPLIGITVPDFYQSQLERRLELASGRLRAARR